MMKKIMRYVLPLMLFFIGVGMMYFGNTRGEAALIFQKAVRICLECIGIG